MPLNDFLDHIDVCLDLANKPLQSIKVCSGFYPETAEQSTSLKRPAKIGDSTTYRPTQLADSGFSS